ncbi:PAP2 superfamily protein [Frondihabitans sp. PhB188]|uniref:phosphatase PAP2 family protein n=1 Tax=Frondihabitans sp. PhB188 TaxID=2485200 RepID=UPI000FC22423|nr:phosphatase PAP2 family protein [Frondihabitans sp. PhB188]ROQ38259.1 PAP2 superfamily protein [Frondihabitans sp. PhB188]
MPLRPPSSSRTPSILPPRILALDRRIGRRVNGAGTGPALDRVLLGLSTAANNGLLWYGVAGALALTGPTGRRAAVRGLLSLGGSSAVANLVAKPLFGGHRPVAADIPVARQLKVFPQSASFPSGHTASAFAFATGVALESPGRAALIAPIAVGVAYSRLHVGAHWVSDVVGGAVIGSGVAVAGQFLRPERLVARLARRAKRAAAAGRLAH